MGSMWWKDMLYLEYAGVHRETCWYLLYLCTFTHQSTRGYIILHKCTKQITQLQLLMVYCNLVLSDVLPFNENHAHNDYENQGAGTNTSDKFQVGKIK